MRKELLGKTYSRLADYCQAAAINDSHEHYQYCIIIVVIITIIIRHRCIDASYCYRCRRA